MTYDLGVPGLADHLAQARVQQVYPDKFTAKVLIYSGRGAGRSLECIIRSIDKNEPSRSGVMLLPNIGDEVYIDWSYGPTPMIKDHVPKLFNKEKTRAYKTKASPVNSFGGEDQMHNKEGKKPYRFGPKDMMPGDKVFMGKRGNMLGILSGGITILKGGALSQIILSKLRDVVKIISRKFELFTDFGVVRFSNDNGANIFEMLGNADSKKSNKHLESNYDYEVRMGGQNLFEFNLMQDKFSVTVDADGGMNFRAAKAPVISLAGAPIIEIEGSQEQNVTGDKTDNVKGDHFTDVSGVEQVKSQRRIIQVAGASNTVVGGNNTTNCQGKELKTVRGTSLTDLDMIGKETRVAAGNYDIVVGNPLDLGIPSPLLAAQGKTGDFNVETYLGDISLQSTVLGNISMQTTLGDIEAFSAVGGLSLTSAAGDVELSTLAGNATVATLAGNVELSTLAGNVSVGTLVGNVEIEALAGSISLKAGTAAIEIGPAGLKISNAGVDLLETIIEVVNTLTTTTAPGFGGPIATAPQFALIAPKLTLLKGA